MKDAYTFDRDLEGLEAAYERSATAYDRIFDRAGLEWYSVESDVGMMGGIGAHEYMAPCAAGENDVALAPGYAANVEVASAEPQPVELPRRWRRPRTLRHAGADHGRRRSRGRSRCPPGALLKAFPVDRRRPGPRGGRGARRPPGQRDQAAPTRCARRSGPRARRSSRARSAPPATSGPSAPRRPSCSTTRSPTAGGYVCGRQPRGHPPARRRAGARLPVRARRRPPRRAGRHRRRRMPIRIEPAIEVGNIFKLGTRFSEPLARPTSTSAGTARHIWMGSYGIGPARIAAAAVEQFADEHGISWPRSLAPFDVELVGLGKPGTDERELADRLYARAARAGPRRPLRRPRRWARGEKFADAELLGLPPAADGRAPDARAGRGRGPGPPGPREPERCRSRAPREAARRCGETSRSDEPADARPGAPREPEAGAERAADVPPSLGPRPVGPAAAADARRRSR